MMRSSWANPKALFLGFKLGSPSVEHGHMDVGSFVFDSDGVRWAMDFGQQEYESLESKNIDLWSYGQNAQRWTVFRYNSLSHNMLTFDNDQQYSKGKATFLKNQIIRTSASQPQIFLICTKTKSQRLSGVLHLKISLMHLFRTKFRQEVHLQ